MSTLATAPTMEQVPQTDEAMPRYSRTAVIPLPNPIPIPIPVFAGSRIPIWKQDPTVADPGIRMTFIPTFVFDGPMDNRIRTELAGITPVHANSSRDFLFAAGTPQFDCSHSFAVVRETLTMYQRIRGGIPLPWAWNTGGNTDPLTIFPRAGVTANAFYSRAQKSLNFFYFQPTGATA